MSEQETSGNAGNVFAANDALPNDPIRDREWVNSLAIAQVAQAAVLDRGIVRVGSALDRVRADVDMTHFEMGFAFCVYGRDRFAKASLFERVLSEVDRNRYQVIHETVRRGLRIARSMAKEEGLTCRTSG